MRHVWDAGRVKQAGRGRPRLSTAPGLGVCESSPVGLDDKTVSWIQNTDEILKLVKKSIN